MQPYQCRAARAMLRISQAELAEAAAVAAKTIADFERESGRVLHPRTVAALRAALEAAGAVFVPEGGEAAGGVLRRVSGAAAPRMGA